MRSINIGTSAWIWVRKSKIRKIKGGWEKSRRREIKTD